MSNLMNLIMCVSMVLMCLYNIFVFVMGTYSVVANKLSNGATPVAAGVTVAETMAGDLIVFLVSLFKKKQ